MGGAFVYWVLCLISPPPGNPYESVQLESEDEAIDGIDGSSASAEAVDMEMGSKH
jgi:hypothetical protein